MIQSHPITDVEKHASLETALRKRYPDWLIIPQAYLVFSKGEDEFQYVSRSLTQEEVENYTIHHPDFYVVRNGRIILLELDGPIHDIKTAKTDARNEIYRLNNLTCIVVNEADLKMKLGIPKSRPLSQKQINDEFIKRLDNL